MPVISSPISLCVVARRRGAEANGMKHVGSFHLFDSAASPNVILHETSRSIVNRTISETFSVDIHIQFL